MSSYPQQPQQTEQYAAQTGEPPLWAPYYGAPIGAAVKRFFKKYATFSGRASRSEYWWVALVLGVVGFVLQILAGVLGAAGATLPAAEPFLARASLLASSFDVVFYLAILIPSLSLLVRRLHDGNFSGWLALLIRLCRLSFFVLSLLPSNPAGQRFDQPTA